MKELNKKHLMLANLDDVMVISTHYRSTDASMDCKSENTVQNTPLIAGKTYVNVKKQVTEQNLDSIPTKQVVMPRMEEYETGDILLFSDKSWIPSRLIEYFTDSKYSHTGIVLRNPVYINEKLDEGLYLLESTGLTDIVDSEDGKLKTGVQIRKLVDVYAEYGGAIFWRKLHTKRNDEFYQILIDAHKNVYDKPYDTNPKDWIESLLNIKIGDVQLTDRFFCSALVAYIYDKWGFVDKTTPWTIIRPKDLGTENITTNRVKLICDIDKEIVIKTYDAYVHYVYYTY